MRNLVLLFLALIVFRCNSSKNNSSTDDGFDVYSYSGPNKPYFDFDKVEYFFIDIDIHKYRENQEQKSDSILKFVDIYERRYPIKMDSVSNFREELIKYGYSRFEIKDSLESDLNTIFSLKECNEGYAAACIPEYRDIFLFYKNEEIIGMSKVCFGCRLDYTLGTEVSTGNFGQCGDFEKLEALVRNPNNLISQ